MLWSAQLLAIMAVLAFGLALLIFIRRAAKVLADTRDTQRFRRRVSDLAPRVQKSLDDVAVRVDGVRRRTLAAEAVTHDIETALAAVDGYTIEARALRGPATGVEIREAIVVELEHARRALEMVEHGCGILVGGRVGTRELEAQTAVKRGYINILHAREALARHAARGASLPGPEQHGFFARRNA
jgi:signal transduction histidine kinase